MTSLEAFGCFVCPDVVVRKPGDAVFVCENKDLLFSLVQFGLFNTARGGEFAPELLVMLLTRWRYK